jgi:hypothetical protein
MNLNLILLIVCSVKRDCHISTKSGQQFWRCNLRIAMLGGIPVPTAWRVLGLRMEERPPDMEVSCEYIE